MVNIKSGALASLALMSSLGTIHNNMVVQGLKTVHIVPHSHDDVGWLSTVDQYFDGTKHDQWTGVDQTISSVVAALLQNPKRKFV